MSGFFVSKVSVSTKALSKLPKFGKDFTDAYLFCLKLRSLVKHPVLFDFNAKSAAVRHLLGYSNKKYQKLLNLAYAKDLIVMRGINLHIIGKSKERRLFNIKHDKYTEIPVSDLKSFTHAQIIIANIKSQKKLISKKMVTSQKAPRLIRTMQQLSNHINSKPNLSLRKIATILGISHTSVANELTSLKRFGLISKKNTIIITKDLFRQYLESGSRNIRYSVNRAKYLFIGANTFELSVNRSEYVRNSMSYCDN